MGELLNVWFWDGRVEYEGVLLKLDAGSFTARVRARGRGESGRSAMGKTVASSSLDLQRQFTHRRFFAHVRGEAPGSLFETSVHSVQRSSDGDFDYLLSGGMTPLDERQLDSLRREAIPLGETGFIRRNVS